MMLPAMMSEDVRMRHRRSRSLDWWDWMIDAQTRRDTGATWISKDGTGMTVARARW